MDKARLAKYKSDLDALVKKADVMLADLGLRDEASRGELTMERKQIHDKVYGTFERDYQRWYTESIAVLQQLLPVRLEEFCACYKADPKRKGITQTTFSIQDWHLGIQSGADYSGKKHFNDIAAVAMRFRTQIEILKSAAARFESSLLEIHQILQADLFDTELEAATELCKAGFLRAAGTLAGVVLEKHLAAVCEGRSIEVRKKNPTISELNDLLKDNRVLDVPTWRFIQRLGDLRNLCAHNRDKEPTEAEVTELIEGVAKISKTVY